jgi:SPP1 gp7 family putative phage head morphogenesis protein
MPSGVDFGRVTPKEAIDFFTRKLALTPDQYAKLSAEARIKAFSIKQIATHEETERLYESLKEALKEGRGYGEWKSGVKELLNDAEINSRQAKLIYRQNMLTAKSVGEWRKIQESVEDFPYLLYDAVMDAHTRPAHAKMHGIIKRADDPFWRRYYPPNGFGCRCDVIQLSDREARREIGAQNREFGTNHTLEEAINESASGFADKGFNYNAGVTEHGGINRLINSREPKGEIAPNQQTYKDYGKPSVREIEGEPIGEKLEADQSADYYKEQMRRVAPKGYAQDPIGQKVIVGDDLINHWAQGGNLGGRGQYLRQSVQTLEKPDEIWLTEYRTDDDAVFLRRRYIKKFVSESGGKPMLSVADTKRGTLSVFTSFIDTKVKHLDAQRLGILIYSLP